MENCAANLDPDHASAAHRGSGSISNRWLNHQRHECRGHIDRHDQFPFTRLTAPSRKVPGNQPILRRYIADPRARLKTLSHNPRLKVIGPSPPPGGTIKDLDPRHSIRPTHLHPVLILVLHRRPPQTQLQAGMPQTSPSRNHGADEPLTFKLQLCQDIRAGISGGAMRNAVITFPPTSYSCG